MKSFETKKEKIRFICSLYFEIGSERSLRKISVHLLPSLSSAARCSVRVHEAEEVMKMCRKPHPNPHGWSFSKTAFLPNGLLASSTQTAFLLTDWKKSHFGRKRDPWCEPDMTTPFWSKRTEAGNKQGEAGDVYLALSFQGPSPPDAIPLSPRPLSSHLSAPHCPQLAACFTHSFHKHICLGLRSTWHCLNYLL